MPNLIVTTSYHPSTELIQEARTLAQQLQVEYIERAEHSISSLRSEDSAIPVLIVRRDRLVCDVAGCVFFFHPSLAKQRIVGLRRGEVDPMVKAMELQPGERVLDCTLGLGADAIVASHCVGSEGQVIGVENVPVIAAIVARGLGEFCSDLRLLNDAMRKVQVICMDHLDFLRTQLAQSFDVVYFDPMFTTPLYQSRPLLPLRKLADHQPLQPKTVAEAIRVARHRVVVKSKRGSTLLQELGITSCQSGSRSRVEFGVIALEQR